MSRTTYAPVTVALFPVLLAGFAILYLSDRDTYLDLLDEDGVIEWVTVALLVLGAGLACRRTRASHQRRHPSRRFYALLTALLLLAALEELSWGQRIFGIESPAFFVRHSDQQELNLHNVFQQWSGITTKWVAALVLSAYGVALPILAHRPAVHAWAIRWQVVIPPRALVPGFLAGVLLMLDLPTYEEEEIAEMVFALCFVLLLMRPEEACVRQSQVAH